MAFLFASSVPHRLRRFGAVLQEKTLMRSNTPRETIAKENKRHSNNYMASATATETAAAAKATATATAIATTMVTVTIVVLLGVCFQNARQRKR